MTQTKHPRAHPETARLIADGVVAAYVHDMSQRHARTEPPAVSRRGAESIGPEAPGRVDPLTS
jgi:hypothetical protein